MILHLSVCLSHYATAVPTCGGFAAERRAYTTSGVAALVTARHSTANVSSVTFSADERLNSTQLYCDTFAAEQVNSWIAKYSSIT